jgi:outer membrane protein assembly factor BamA
MRSAVGLLLLGLAASAARAQDWPVIRAIEFDGNETTRPAVMLREMVVSIGDPADPERIERSRQGILDLGLFKSVSVTQAEEKDGVRLIFTVREKWYILPIPRYDVNSDGENVYGLSVRWFNVAGLNHTLRANWSSRDEKQSNQGRITGYHLGYAMPFVLDSPYNVYLGLSHKETPVTDPIPYRETINAASVGLSRTYPTETASQGWTVGGGLTWSEQQTHGAAAPPAYGTATEFRIGAGFRDVRFRVYSDEGVSYGASFASAIEGVGSDYSYNVFDLHGVRRMALGETPHHSLHLLGALGSYHGGPPGVTIGDGAYDLGGTGRLRGYESDFRVGDAYYYLALEYLHPLYWNSLRFLVVAEAGNVFDDAHAATLGHVYASVGVGVRLRITFLVNVEIEAGWAWPLSGRGSRFFASGV